jgi:hypothetical protein
VKYSPRLSYLRVRKLFILQRPFDEKEKNILSNSTLKNNMIIIFLEFRRRRFDEDFRIFTFTRVPVQLDRRAVPGRENCSPCVPGTYSVPVRRFNSTAAP